MAIPVHIRHVDHSDYVRLPAPMAHPYRNTYTLAEPYNRCEDNGPFRPHIIHDKLASEDFGKELNPESPIWKLYLEESKEQDNELTDRCNKDLDMLLLFATLFSAILTAFLIESAHLLEPDPSETSLELLLALAQSQRRIEIGAPDTLLPPVETTPFEPSHLARLVNALWFSALVISLGAAMVGILAKEWLSWFQSYKTRNPYQYTLQRQARFRSLVSWGMLPIIDFLPTLLNFSLLLFAIGLIVRLWTIDYVVAGVVTALTALVGLSYGGFTIFGATVDTCPYKSRLSVYIGMIWPRFNSSEGKSPKPPSANKRSHIKPTDLDSLSWLLDNSKDPTTVDYTYQALAGLKSLKLDPSMFTIRSAQGFLPSVNQSNVMTWGNVLRMGAQIVDRLGAMNTKYRDELAAFEGKNAARYAMAISEIYPVALAWVQQPNTPDEIAQHYDSSPTMQDNACKIVASSFTALDSFWNRTSLPLTLSSRRGLVLAGLKLIKHSLINHRIMGHPVLDPNNSDTDRMSISMPSTNGPGLLELRGRYQHALVCFSTSIQEFVGDQDSMDDILAHSLIHDMLLMVTELVGHQELHTNGTFDYEIYISDGDYQVKPVGRYPGVIESLMGLLSCWKPDSHIGVANPRYQEKFLNSALRLVAILRPKITKQWASINNVTWWPCFFHDHGASGVTRSHSPRSPSRSIVYQCLEMASFLVFFLGQPDMDDMIRILDATLKLLVPSRNATAQSECYFLHNVLLGKPFLLFEWIEKIQAYEPSAENFEDSSYQSEVTTETEYLKGRVCRQIVELLAIQGPNNTTICSGLMRRLVQEGDHRSDHLIAVLKMLRAAERSYGEAATEVLHDLVEHITTAGDFPTSIEARGPCSICLDCFTQGEGFELLQGMRLLRQDAVANAIIDIINQSVVSRKRLKPAVVDSFLKAVDLVCNCRPESWNRLSNSFVPAVIQHLQQLDPGLESIVTSGTIHEIQFALASLHVAAHSMSIMPSKKQAISDLDNIIESLQKYSPMVNPSLYDGESTSSVRTSVEGEGVDASIRIPGAGVFKRHRRLSKHVAIDTRRRPIRVNYNDEVVVGGNGQPPIDRAPVIGSSYKSGEDTETESKMRPEIRQPSLGPSHVASSVQDVSSESSPINVEKSPLRG